MSCSSYGVGTVRVSQECCGEEDLEAFYFFIKRSPSRVLDIPTYLTAQRRPVHSSTVTYLPEPDIIWF